MQKQISAVCASLTVIAMLLAAGVSVNHRLPIGVGNSGSQLADGIPMPPPKPPKTSVSGNVLVSDDIPMPAPKPPKSGYRS